MTLDVARVNRITSLLGSSAVHAQDIARIVAVAQEDGKALDQKWWLCLILRFASARKLQLT